MQFFGFGLATRKGRSRSVLYVALDKLMAVDVFTSPTFKAGAPQSLFTPTATFNAGRVHQWDLSRDAQRFLIEITGEDIVAAPVTVLVNWQSHLSVKRQEFQGHTRQFHTIGNPGCIPKRKPVQPRSHTALVLDIRCYPIILEKPSSPRSRNRRKQGTSHNRLPPGNGRKARRWRRGSQWR
jgi:hypothetical protein